MINPWNQGRVPGLVLFPWMGAWQSKHPLANGPFVPPQWVRESLRKSHPYWYQFPRLTLAAGETQLARISTGEDFFVLAIMSNASVTIPGGSFRLRIYEDESAYTWNAIGVNQGNAAPNAKEPMLQRVLHKIQNGSPVNCAVQNLANAVNIVDLCLFGYSGWWRH